MKTEYILFGILIAVGMLHLAIINTPQVTVGDEAYYVSASQAIANGTVCALHNATDIYSVIGCNLVHPPLVKLVMAGAIAVFGNNPFSWRIFSVVTGILSILMIFLIARELSLKESTALLAAGLLGIESMFFLESSLAFLDIPSVFFGLVGIFLYLKFRKHRFSYLIVSVPLTLSMLSKETGVAMLVFVVLYAFLTDRKKAVRFSVILVVLTLALSLSGLELYDLAFTTTNAITNLEFFFGFHLLVHGPGWVEVPWPLSGLTSLFGPYITPLNWIALYSPVPYYTPTSDPTQFLRFPLHYVGMSNMIEVWLLFLWVPLFVLQFTKYSKSKFNKKAILFCLLAFALFFGGYLLLFLLGQTTYPFYIVQFSPFLVLADAILLSSFRSRAPMMLVLVLSVAWFLLFFPVYPLTPPP